MHAPARHSKPELQLVGKAQSEQPLPSETQSCTCPCAVQRLDPAAHCATQDDDGVQSPAEHTLVEPHDSATTQS